MGQIFLYLFIKNRFGIVSLLFDTIAEGISKQHHYLNKVQQDSHNAQKKRLATLSENQSIIQKSIGSLRKAVLDEK